MKGFTDDCVRLLWVTWYEMKNFSKVLFIRLKIVCIRVIYVCVFFHERSRLLGNMIDLAREIYLRVVRKFFSRENSAP